ncbi:type II toxin-antitoxin system PemK/MazF family toxin [Lentilactobacillus kisonensis]|uniref:Toxin-antitoxin system, toxin component, MazF family n=2 Tax=Lentilactobacillus kisonensis TaxID=481722 RepID=H1LFP3_9LACO|nr:type II toxin-antitoxin system PemK/MazF family toxin [Lentilactobacillus kisonensis]EHO51639.1 toxin-antitoxin system, toxin component, MazF family [Lentilactobacillus kisonensis F0435]KRL23123.1 toxin-antitoxin system, toxin component, MazF family [Lentilactobacillus kisonensis DSM 19906 = JCM 15041]
MKDLNQHIFDKEKGDKEWYDQGSVVWCDFDPTKGHEQQKGRLAVVVSSRAFYLLTRMIKVVAISSSESQKDFPINVALPIGMQVKGYVLTDQERSIDPSNRNISFIERCPDEVLKEILKFVLMTYE